ncbi:hypothetical protein KI387_031581, partial [Taxus chinensis]
GPPLCQATGHIENLSVANPLDGEFPYINENLDDFTNVENEEEVREREAREKEEIRAQLEEIERLQVEADERAATEATTLA